jgi:hypothetical protein
MHSMNNFYNIMKKQDRKAMPLIYGKCKFISKNDNCCFNKWSPQYESYACSVMKNLFGCPKEKAIK